MDKTRILISAAAVILATAACDKDAPALTAAKDDTLAMTFTAYADDPATKTSLGPGNSILWSVSDAITLFAATGAEGERFSVASVSDDGKEATFKGLSKETSNGYYYALSPASQGAVLVSSSGTINASLPSSQTVPEGSFAPEANLCIARVDTQAQEDSGILRFKNVGALLAIRCPGNYINKIRVVSNAPDVAMTGPANIKFNDGAPAVSATTTSKNYVELNIPEGSAGKLFYAVVYPGSYSKGFTVTFFAYAAYNSYTSSKPLELRRNNNILLIDKDWTVSDDRGAKSTKGTELIAPEISSGGQISATSAKITFSCSSGKRDIYKLYIRDAASMGEGTLVNTMNTGSGQPGKYDYTFTGLVTGASYDLGVSASCTDSNFGDSPVTWLEDVTINAVTSNVSISINSTASTYYNFTVNYTISGLKDTGAEHGLLYSYDNASPTCGAVGQAGKLYGPEITSSGTVRLSQCVPNAPLRPGEKCYVRAYCYDNEAGNYVYSPVSELTLEQQPSALPITKASRTSPDAGIELYSFTADGSKGYYAAADCSSAGRIRFGINNANLGTTQAQFMASQQSSSGALVLVNGQIFGQEGNIGIAYTGGALRYNNSSSGGISACRGYSNSYTTTWQPITRAILGVNSAGAPGAYWCSLIDGAAYFFERPIPAGSNVYPQVSQTAGPGPKLSWSPQEALSTGPMLLYDGKVCVSQDRISTGVYYTNYELWETSDKGNIYSSSRPRTAIGYDSSGKMYLVAVTSNVTMTRMALIMKGLGCTYAMNLDGGGSTQMYVKGQGELTGNSRSVKSTAGFFLR